MRKSLKIAVSLPLVAALMGLGAVPAQANGVVLPPNANGTDNSGIMIEACPNSLHMKLPTTPSADPEDSALAAMYHNFGWTVDVAGFGSYNAESSEFTEDPIGNAAAKTWTAILTDGVNGATPGEVLDFTLTAKSKDQFGNETISSNPISLQVTVLDPEAFASGTGTKTDPYVITTAEQLNLVRCHDNKYFELGNSIDLNNEPWLPIRGGYTFGYQEDYKKSNIGFDGNGYTISNLFVDTQFESAGLFGTLENSVVKNLVLESPEVWGNNYTGSLAGNSRYSQFVNIKVTDAEIHSYGERAGGLIGWYDYRGIFRNIEVDGQITGEAYVYEYVYDQFNPNAWSYRQTNTQGYGGLIGYDDGDGTFHENNTTNVNITVTSDNGYAVNNDHQPTTNRVGGYIGEAGEDVMLSNIESNSVINIDAYSINDIGGLTGDAEESLFSDVKVTSTINIEATYARTTGGVSGNIDSASFTNIDSDTEINVYVTYSARKIAGAFGEFEDAGFSNSEIEAKINIVALESGDQNTRQVAEDVSGVVGYTDSGSLHNIRASSTIDIMLADGTNNPGNIDLVNGTGLEVDSVGGFLGEHDDYSSYADIESSTVITIDDFETVENIGGGVGYISDYHSVAFNHILVKGTINVPNQATSVGGLMGVVWGSLNLVKILVAVNVSEGQGMVGVGPIIGSFGGDQQYSAEYESKTRSYNTFWDSSVESMENNYETVGTSATTAEMSDVAWLTANQFDTTRFWKVEGSYPTLRLTIGTPVASFVKYGQANKKLSLVFSPVAKGKRTFKINLASKFATKKIKLVVVRGGVKVKTIKAGTLDGLGDRTFKSKLKLKAADKLQVKIGKKTVASHTVR